MVGSRVSLTSSPLPTTFPSHPTPHHLHLQGAHARGNSLTGLHHRLRILCTLPLRLLERQPPTMPHLCVRTPDTKRLCGLQKTMYFKPEDGYKVLNNFAEYKGLLAELRVAVALGTKRLIFKGDLQLIVKFSNTRATLSR
ncbi:hypothetical protein QYE76_021032 [Lolium multiflorum]|uniref:RNase H type-1 domain-containing protein n=1 Tax=Lolium multiflorum TaxID=4521 RepID=A0AAD8VSG2_LOLMU|nr:hypothetical protein QYE76_021032 [Lolium multiflorum]